jgi:hypothetical protein
MRATRTFTCGHEAEEPLHMGRGKARERRLSEYFGRKCFECRLAATYAQASQLKETVRDSSGNPVFNEAGKRVMASAPGWYKAQKFQQWVKRYENSY